MTAILLGSFTLGDAIPGLTDVLDKTGQGLDTMRQAADTAIGAIGRAKDELDGLANQLDNIKSDLTSSALAPIYAALDAAQDLLSKLDAITNPADYLAGIIAQLDAAKAALLALIPADYVGDLIAGAQSAISSFEGNIRDLESQLNDLTDIAGIVADQTAFLNDIQDALGDALDATLGALAGYLDQMSQLLNSGVHVVSYNGQLSSLGSEVDAVLPGTGIGGSTFVAGPILIVKTADTATLSALNSVFGL